MYYIAASIFHEILSIALLTAAVCCLLKFLGTREKIFLFTSEYLIAQFILDGIVLCCEFPGPLSTFISSFFSASAMPKVIIYAVSVILLLLISLEYLKEKIKIWHILLVCIVDAYMLTGAMLINNSIAVSWVILSSYQIYTFALSLFVLKKAKINNINTSKQIKTICFAYMIGSVMIFLEDTITLKYISNPTDPAANIIKERNFCEDILLILISLLTIYAMGKTIISCIADRRIPADENSIDTQIDSDSAQLSNEKIRNMAWELGLSTRETEILPLLLDGKNNQEICDELHIAPGTVKTHIYHIYQKTDVNDRASLIRLAMEYI